jgi:hypothetical protein
MEYIFDIGITKWHDGEVGGMKSRENDTVNRDSKSRETSRSWEPMYWDFDEKPIQLLVAQIQRQG